MVRIYGMHAFNGTSCPNVPTDYSTKDIEKKKFSMPCKHIFFGCFTISFGFLSKSFSSLLNLSSLLNTGYTRDSNE